MSKFSQALEKIQKEQLRQKSGGKERRDSIFLSPLDTHIRERSGLDKAFSVLSMLRPLLLVALVVIIGLVFFVGVQQGMKIRETLTRTEETGEAGNTPRPESGKEEPGEEARSVESSGPSVAPPEEPETAVPAEQAASRSIPAAPVSPEAPDVSPAEAVTDTLQGRFTIQLIAYGTLERARAEAARLEELGYEPMIIPGDTYFQVCLNRFESVAEARRFLNELDAGDLLGTYPGAYVRNVPQQTETR